jgi:hypothetical protein
MWSQNYVQTVNAEFQPFNIGEKFPLMVDGAEFKYCKTNNLTLCTDQACGTPPPLHQTNQTINGMVIEWATIAPV